MDGCEIKRCRAGADLIYLGHGVCERHWNQLMADDAPPDAIRKALGIEAAPVAAMEEAMDATEKGTKRAEVAVAPVKGKGGKKPVKVKVPAAPRPKREKIPAEDVCVFAFRLSTKDRDRIHEAAGGGKASGFVLAAALAAASGDVEAFKTVIASRATTK